MLTKITLDNQPADREQDPMAIRKSRTKAASTRSKIKKTGLKKSYCHGCEKTLSISRFSIKKTGNNRNKDKKKPTKPRKNTPSAPYAPQRECNKCLMEKKKESGQYERDKERKKKIYHSDESSRKTLREAAIRSREVLSDSYLRKLLKAQGYTNAQIRKNPKLLKDKRKEIADKRKSAAENTHVIRKKTGFYSKRDRAQLKPAYLRGLIKNSKSYKGEEITEEMLAKKKKEVLHERATGDKIWVVRKTPQQRKETVKATSDNRIKTLSVVYIKSRIKGCVWYKGEEITDAMIEAHRAEIEAYRDRKEKGIKRLSSAHYLTQPYVRSVIAAIKKIPKEQVTDEEILQKTDEIAAKRARRAQKVIDKQQRAELKAQRERDRKEAEALEYKHILEEAAEQRKRKLARLKPIKDKKAAKQAKKDAEADRIKKKKEKAAVILVQRRVLEIKDKYKQKLKAEEAQKQREREHLEAKEAKRKAKAAAKKVKRLAKKVKKENTPTYSFFTPHELRH